MSEVSWEAVASLNHCHNYKLSIVQTVRQRSRGRAPACCACGPGTAGSVLPVIGVPAAVSQMRIRIGVG
jgi:hypothetical protein